MANKVQPKEVDEIVRVSNGDCNNVEGGGSAKQRRYGGPKLRTTCSNHPQINYDQRKTMSRIILGNDERQRLFWKFTKITLPYFFMGWAIAQIISMLVIFDAIPISYSRLALLGIPGIATGILGGNHTLMKLLFLRFDVHIVIWLNVASYIGAAYLFAWDERLYIFTMQSFGWLWLVSSDSFPQTKKMRTYVITGVVIGMAFSSVFCYKMIFGDIGVDTQNIKFPGTEFSLSRFCATRALEAMALEMRCIWRGLKNDKKTFLFLDSILKSKEVENPSNKSIIYL